jgi:hypothetical protein
MREGLSLYTYSSFFIAIATYQTLLQTSNALDAADLGGRLGIFWALLVFCQAVDQSVNRNY